MTPLSPVEISVRDASRRVAIGAATASAAIASLSMAGWLGGPPELKYWLPGASVMNPLSCLMILLSSAHLFLQVGATGRAARFTRLLLAAIVIAVTAFFLASIRVPSLIAIDQLMFSASLGGNRMAPNTAAVLLLIGIALAISDRKSSLRALAQGCTVLAGTLPLLSILGYLYGARPLYSVGKFNPMAFNTAIALTCLAIGVAAISEGGKWIRLLFDPGPAGVLIRRVLPVSLIGPSLLGWLRLQGSRRGFYSHEIGVAIMVVTTIAIFATLSIWLVRSFERLELSRVDRERITQEKIRLEAEILERERGRSVLMQLNSELAVARDEALESTRLKSAILANVSHELRTPLTIIRGYIDILRSSASPGSEMMDILDVLARSAHRLTGLIDDFIELAQIEGSLVKCEREWFEVVPLLEKAVADHRAFLELNGNTVTADFSEAAVSIRGDAAKLRRAIDQILVNAGKFTSGGSIAIGARPTLLPGEVEAIAIAVRDSGIGIPLEQLGKLFKPFVQLDDTSSRSFGGVGLGLVLARRLCTAMGGDLTVESTAGNGSCFTIRVPREPPEDPQSRVQELRSAAHSANRPYASSGSVHSTIPLIDGTPD